MPERLDDRHLHPQTRQALRLAHQLTGKRLRLRQVDYLEGQVNAFLQMPTKPGRPCEIVYLSGQNDVLDHLVTHEVGHVVRLHQVPEEDRLLARIQPLPHERAARHLLTEIPEVLTHLTPKALARVIVDWQRDVATQTANFPADLRIEQWIHDRYPGLRSVQERSLLREVVRCEPLFHPFVSLLTPRTVYQATMAMNAAQAWHVSELYHRPDLMEPFRRAGLADTGRELAQMVFDTPDEGHRSDIAASDAWSARLGLGGWFAWYPYRPDR